MKRELEEADSPDAKRTKEEILEESKLLFERAQTIIDTIDLEKSNALDEFATAADYLECIFAEDSWWNEEAKLKGYLLLLHTYNELIRGTEATMEENSFLRKALLIVEALEGKPLDLPLQEEADYLIASILFQQYLIDKTEQHLLVRAEELLGKPSKVPPALLLSDVQREMGFERRALQVLLPFEDNEEVVPNIIELRIEIALQEGDDALSQAEAALELSTEEEEQKTAVETIAYLLLKQFKEDHQAEGMKRLEVLHEKTTYGFYNLACFYALNNQPELCRNILSKHELELDPQALKTDEDLASVRNLDWFKWKD